MINKLFGNAKGIFNRLTMIDIIISLICIIIGIFFYADSYISNIVLSIIIGLILIINGIFSIYTFLKRENIDLYKYNFIYGALFIIAGILSFILRNNLSILLGIYLIIVGIQKANYGLFLKKYNESSWLLTLVVGVLFIAIAIITMFANNDTIVEVTGIYLLGFGFINIVNIILLRRRSEYFIS